MGPSTIQIVPSTEIKVTKKTSEALELLRKIYFDVIYERSHDFFELTLIAIIQNITVFHLELQTPPENFISEDC